MEHYYNTNHESAKTLIESRLHNKNQEEWLLSIFAEDPSIYFTREDIEKITGLKEGSVSRTLANLTESLKIEKTHNFKISSYGKKVHTWKFHDGSNDEFENIHLNNPPIQLNLFKPIRYTLKIKEN